MSGPITPHIEISEHADGVHLKLRHVEIVLPPSMALDVADLLTTTAWKAMGKTPLPLPIVTPRKDPIR